jgi:creatinine amidohydrolase
MGDKYMNNVYPFQNIFTNTMADMKWPEIQHHADNNAIVLLPIGVIEEHGPHLCLATDIYTAHIYCLFVKQKLEEKGFSAIIAPPFYWGICQAGRGFIGSFNIRSETAKALLFDILTSLRDFGFKRVFGVNGHGDVEHKIAAVKAFKDACEQLKITACFPYNKFMTEFFEFHKDEPCFYEIRETEISFSSAKVPDVHAGDIETATINAFYPYLVDAEIAKSQPDIALGDNFEAWMFGGQLKQLSPQGYIGSPANFVDVNATQNIEDYAHRISEAILTRINKN